MCLFSMLPLYGISSKSFMTLSPEISPMLRGPDCRVEAAAATHLCDGSLDGHGMDSCHGRIATIL